MENDNTFKLKTKLDVDDIMELLEFVLTYFSFREREKNTNRSSVQQWVFRAAQFIANIFMEWLEHRALATAPADCMP